MSYTILDKRLNVAGVLSLDSNNIFYADKITTQIADSENGKMWNDTLTISVPYDNSYSSLMTEGYHLIHKGSDGKYYCYRINQWEDQPAGETHVKVCSGINLAIWDLAHTIISPIKKDYVTLQDAFNYALSNSGWQVDLNDASSGTHTLDVSLGTTGQSLIQTLTKTYSVEIRAYVELTGGQVTKKIIDVHNKMGIHTGKRIEYGRNMTSITRTGGDDTLFTKLHVYGGTPTNQDNPISISPVNGGKDFIIDDAANDRYNEAGKYLEGWIQNESIWNNYGLLDWGKEQLKYYNHPKYNYTVGIAQLDWKPNLGDYADVVDFSMSPALTIQSRVIQKTESEADPYSNTVTLGEFVELSNVTPSDIVNLQSQALAAQHDAEKNQTPTVKEFTPDGTDFENENQKKRVIVRVYQGMNEITYQIKDENYIWQKINADGNHDTEWESKHRGSGNTIIVDSSIIGCVVRCTIQDESISTLPIYFQNGMNWVINKLASIQSEDTLSILFITDTHYASGGYSNTSIMMRSTDHMRNASYLTNQSKIDLIVHGGDLVDGYQNKPEMLENTDTAARSLYDNAKSPIIFINGNHDDASLYSSRHAGNSFNEVLTPSDRYNILNRYETNNIHHHAGFENRLYGYYDFPEQKIRVICLNVFENPYIKKSDGTNKYLSQFTTAVLQDQFDWLTQDALNLDSSWSILVFCHTRYTFNLSESYQNINFNLLRGVINAFKDGTTYSGNGTKPDYEAHVSVDYTGTPHDVIGVIFGHGHWDGDWEDNGIPLIETMDCMARNDYPGEMPDRPFQSLNEDAWDVVTVDRKNRTIYFTRFGAGTDRIFHY